MNGRRSSTTVFQDCFSPQSIERVYREFLSDSGTIGTDGIGKRQFSDSLQANVNLIYKKVLSGRYRFTRYRERLVSKGANKFPRELSIPTIRDRLVLRCLLAFLTEIFVEARARRPHDYIRRLKQSLSLNAPNTSFVRADIVDFYPSIDQNRLMRTLRRKIRNKNALDLIRGAIETGNQAGEKRRKGIPQGLSISNILSNIYLEQFDTKMSAQRTNRFFRYADDILLIVPEPTSQSCFEDVVAQARRHKLSIHPIGTSKGKSHICRVDEGIEYLGFKILPNRISVRQSSYRKMMDTLAAVVTAGLRSQKKGRMCLRLDTKITGCVFNERRYGWLHFFQQTDDIRQLARLDKFVMDQLSRVEGLPDGYKPKRFVKAYNEIKFRANSTDYIPNFSQFSREDQIAWLTRIRPHEKADFDSLSQAEIQNRFFRVVTREISELERDLQEVTS